MRIKNNLQRSIMSFTISKMEIKKLLEEHGEITLTYQSTYLSIAVTDAK